jgi:1-acyl-sn-glycerol-3-phosphate acyltransferase
MSHAPVSEAAAEQRVLRSLRGLMSELGPPRPVSLGSSLERDLGLGSLERVELLSRLELEFELRFPDSVLATSETVADLVRAVLNGNGRLPAESIATVATTLGAAQAPSPESTTNLLEALHLWAEVEPNRPQVILRREDGSEQAITYGELARRSASVAADLVRLGVGAGDRVAIMLPTGEEFFYSFLGIWMAQAVPVPMYPPFRADRMEEYAQRQAGILRNAEAVLMITIGRGETLGKLLRPLAPSLTKVVDATGLGRGAAARPIIPHGGDRPALIQYTSGSTGDPKGVLLTHGNLLANVRAVSRAFEVGPHDSGVSWLPLYHDMGLIGAWLMPLYVGFPVTILSPLAFLSRPERWLWAIHYHRATISVGPNFAYELCVRKIPDEALEGLDLSPWRVALNGSEPVRVSTIEHFVKRFGPYGFRPEAMLPVYGLAESTVGLSSPPVGRGVRIDRVRRSRLEEDGVAEPDPGGLEMVSVGRPLPGHEIRIVDEAGREAAERVQGRIQFRGPSTMQGYYRRPAETAAITFDGWTDSGDLGYRADGELYITGRSKDVILKAGRNLHPHDIEAAVAEVEGVRKGCVAAFGAADERQGTERLVVAAETRESDAEAREQLRAAIEKRIIDAIGIPADEIVFLAPGALPKTSSGKLRRAQCRRSYETGKLGARGRSVTWQWVRLGAVWAPHTAKRAARSAWHSVYGIWCLISLAIAFFGGRVLVLFGGRRNPELVKWAGGVFGRLAGIGPTLEGAENLPPGPAIVVSNHGSYLDSPLYLAAMPRVFTFIAKREVLDTPILRTLIRRGGHLVVERRTPGKSAADAEQLVTALQAGKTLVVFAEGTFTRARGLRPFRLGAFQAAARVGCPVVPAAILGSRRLLPDRSWLPRYSPIRVILRPPIYPQGDDWREVLRLRDAAFQEILAHCGEPRLEVASAEIPE